MEKEPAQKEQEIRDKRKEARKFSWLQTLSYRLAMYFDRREDRLRERAANQRERLERQRQKKRKKEAKKLGSPVVDKALDTNKKEIGAPVVDKALRTSNTLKK